jgi:hypothetical protein
MKLQIIKAIINWLNRHYPYLLMDAVIPAGSHLHKNPQKQRVIANMDGVRVSEGTLANITVVHGPSHTESTAWRDPEAWSK